MIKIRLKSFIVLDKEDETLFDVLPLTHTPWGFQIVIYPKKPTPAAKTYYTSLAEIVMRQRGKAYFKNGCKYDLRKSNIQLTAWKKPEV